MTFGKSCQVFFLCTCVACMHGDTLDPMLLRLSFPMMSLSLPLSHSLTVSLFLVFLSLIHTHSLSHTHSLCLSLPCFPLSHTHSHTPSLYLLSLSLIPVIVIPLCLIQTHKHTHIPDVVLPKNTSDLSSWQEITLREGQEDSIPLHAPFAPYPKFQVNIQTQNHSLTHSHLLTLLYALTQRHTHSLSLYALPQRTHTHTHTHTHNYTHVSEGASGEYDAIKEANTVSNADIKLLERERYGERIFE